MIEMCAGRCGRKHIYEFLSWHDRHLGNIRNPVHTPGNIYTIPMDRMVQFRVVFEENAHFVSLFYPDLRPRHGIVEGQCVDLHGRSQFLLGDINTDVELFPFFMNACVTAFQ